jgi:hypothetical protein
MAMSNALETTSFRSWFKEQYQRCPNQRKRDVLRAKVAELETALSKAQVELNLEDRLQESWTDALYGWNARQK